MASHIDCLDVSHYSGKTLLMRAAIRGAIQILKICLSKGANINKFDVKGNTALHFAVEYNHIEIVEILVANGANINQTTNSEQTPLHHAVTYNRKKIVEFLIAKGADIDKLDDIGFTPLKSAIVHGYQEIVKILEHHTKIKHKVLPLICAREFIEESLFHGEYLPRDMFRVIMGEVIENVDNV